jgi:hypothetical protein
MLLIQQSSSPLQLSRGSDGNGTEIKVRIGYRNDSSLLASKARIEYISYPVAQKVEPKRDNQYGKSRENDEPRSGKYVLYSIANQVAKFWKFWVRRKSEKHQPRKNKDNSADVQSELHQNRID